MDIAVPCGLFLFTFFFCAGLGAWYVKHRYIDPLEWRVRRLERALQPPQPHTTGSVPKTPGPRYVTIEQRRNCY